MNFVPDNLPDDPELLKQMLANMQSRMGVLEEQVALLRQRKRTGKPSCTIKLGATYVAAVLQSHSPAASAGVSARPSGRHTDRARCGGPTGSSS